MLQKTFHIKANKLNIRTIRQFVSYFETHMVSEQKTVFKPKTLCPIPQI